MTLDTDNLPFLWFTHCQSTVILGFECCTAFTVQPCQEIILGQRSLSQNCFESFICHGGLLEDVSITEVRCAVFHLLYGCSIHATWLLVSWEPSCWRFSKPFSESLNNVVLRCVMAMWEVALGATLDSLSPLIVSVCVELRERLTWQF